MNYSIFIIKIIKSPEQSFFEDDTALTEAWVQFPQFLNQNYCDTFKLSAWGNLAYDLNKFYNVNDYLIIEGFLSLKENYQQNYVIKNEKQIEFTALKLYPFILNNRGVKWKFKNTTQLPF
tara:strand:- start:22295 stop:22654 length:360 start_codon:yes stop_codon:yes gene_type:complete